MNDQLIRQAFHKSYLRKYHISPDTIVIDELGLLHGKCRADIVVINGCMSGFEIKSGKDSLVRLKNQVEIYNSVFDFSTIVLENCHLNEALDLLPEWWGIILVDEKFYDLAHFVSIRDATPSPLNDDFSLAHLLWRNEAIEILEKFGVKGKKLRECRSNLYKYIMEITDSKTLKGIVREYLKKRQGWRDLEPPVQYDDLSPLCAM